jgi:hypothetical protein
MRRIGSRLSVFLVILGALTVLLGWSWREHVRRSELAEPLVGSTPLGRWLLTHSSAGRDLEVEAAVAQAGGKAVPVLVWFAELGLSPLELRLSRLWSRLPTLLRHATGPWIRIDPNRSAEAMRLLGGLGPEASNAVPVLLRLARVDFQRTGASALAALLAIAPEDPRVRPVELAWLNSDPLLASYYFRAAHCTYPEALPILLRAIAADPSGAVNEAHALAQYGVAASNALPSLRIMLKSRTADALSVLHEMGPPAAPAAAELAGLLSDREQADMGLLDTLRRIGPGAAVTMPQVERYLTATNPVTRLLAEATVASLRGEPAAVLPSLQRTLETHQPFGTRYELSVPLLGDDVLYPLGPRGMSCWLAGEMGPSAVSILPSLEACFEDEGRLLRVLAAWGHWRIAHRPEKVLPALRAVLRSEDPPVRRVAICALIEIGPPAAAAEPELEAIRTADLETRRLVNWALAEIHREGR